MRAMKVLVRMDAPVIVNIVKVCMFVEIPSALLTGSIQSMAEKMSIKHSKLCLGSVSRFSNLRTVYVLQNTRLVIQYDVYSRINKSINIRFVGSCSNSVS